MNFFILFSIFVFFCVLFASKSREAIPRACSTSTTDQFPFCNPKLSYEDRLNDLIGRIRDDEKAPLLTARESPGGNIPRIGLPEYDWGCNCIHGVESRCGTKCPTSFPAPNALGATFNNTIFSKMGSIIGLELRSLWLQGVGENHDNNLPHIGLDCWSPNININRDPRWGRNEEVPSEDPFLAGNYGVEYTKGLQNGEDPRFLQAVVTLKHWAAYSLENYKGVTRHNFNAKVAAYDLTNTYFPAWKAAVTEANAKGVMCSYNALNGVPTCADKFLNATLRGTWKFDGYITSDTGAVEDIYANHKYVSNSTAAAAVALLGGTDINSGGVYKSELLNAMKENMITDDDINLALRRTLGLRLKLGLFDPIDDQPYWHVSPDVVNTPESQEFNLFATQSSLVLLKNNDKTLPFPKGKTVAVVGPHGNATRDLLGNYLGQICMDRSYNCVPSVFDQIGKANEGGKTSYLKGCDVDSSDKSGFAAAVKLAGSADYVVLAVGSDGSVEGEGHDRTSITLPGVQNDFVSEILAVKKPTVVVLINGGSMDIQYIKDNADSILVAFYPGFQGGAAIASVLFGDFNPGGKLPVTFYPSGYIDKVDFEDMSMTKSPGRSYRYFTGTPQYPFGYGLSYTTFTLDQTNCSNEAIRDLYELRSEDLDAEICFNIKVTNTGDRKGTEVVQAYFTPTNEAPLIKQLFGYERVSVDPGKSETVKFTFNPTSFKMGEENGDLSIFPGDYEIQFTNGVDQVIRSKLSIQGEKHVLEKFTPI